MPRRVHSSLILVSVFVLGIAGGIVGMVWAWPGLRAHYFRPQRPTFIQFMQKSLDLTPAQVPKVQAIYKETGERGHEIHLQFVPAYNQVCDQYMKVRSQEDAAFGPVRQEELDKMHAVLTATQWQKFQQQRAAAMKAFAAHQRDACRHMQGAPAGPPPGGRGRRGRGPRRNGPPRP